MTSNVDVDVNTSNASSISSISSSTNKPLTRPHSLSIPYRIHTIAIAHTNGLVFASEDTRKTPPCLRHPRCPAVAISAVCCRCVAFAQSYYCSIIMFGTKFCSPSGYSVVDSNILCSSFRTHSHTNTCQDGCASCGDAPNNGHRQTRTNSYVIPHSAGSEVNMKNIIMFIFVLCSVCSLSSTSTVDGRKTLVHQLHRLSAAKKCGQHSSSVVCHSASQ